ncbi:MAG: FAD-binding oxidoreductase, partial [Longimicrobiales bacterium]
LTLGGGLGWLRGMHGLTCDNLVAAEVVLADGQVVRASEDDHAELLWGLRGGGGNFGVVTRFEFTLHPVGPDVFFAFAFHDGRRDGMRDALRRYRDFCVDIPDTIAPVGVCGVIPPGHEMFPAELYGVPFFLAAAMYAGSPEEGERALEPLRSLGEPLADFSGRMLYTEAQKIFDDDYPAVKLRYYWKSANLTGLDDVLIDRIVEHAKRQPSPLSTTDIWHRGGAVSRIPEDAAAFGGRDARFLLNAEANWADPRQDEANVRWVRDFHDAVRAYSDGRAYLNFPGFHEGGEASLRATFGGKYDRLLALKRRVDPDNVFRSNQNIDPAGQR